MPKLPADEDYARALLSIFSARRLRPQQSLGLEEARGLFLARNLGKAADFQAALDYAVSQAWLWTGFDRVRLTAPGDEEMQTIWMGRGLGGEPPQRKPPAPSGRPLKWGA